MNTTPTTILRIEEVMRRTGLKRTAIYIAVRDGKFPAPIKLGPRASGWIETEIEGWLRARIQESRSRTAPLSAPPASV